MLYLLDTNILLRLTNENDLQYDVANEAVLALQDQGHSLRITPQVLIEFRAVATRSAAVNGLGLPVSEAEQKAAEFEATFPLLDDIPEIFPAWQSLVSSAGVVGKQVHDARLVAVCHAHGVTHILTFNGAHFAGLARVAPGLVVVDPVAV